MHDEKAGARKEIEQLFRNKSLTHNNFINYAEKFRTLARLSELEDSYLIEKLKEVLPDNLRLAITVQGGNASTKWSIFLDQLLAFYKLLNPDKAQERIFSKDVEKDENAMNVDVAQKKKAKGKQANTASTQKPDTKKPFCTICNRTGHDTKDCHKLAANANKAKAWQKKREESRSKLKAPSNTATSGTTQQKKKKMRLVEVEYTDSEDEAGSSQSPGAGPSKKINTLTKLQEGGFAKLEEVREPQQVESTVPFETPKTWPMSRRSAASFDPKDFLKRQM
jgi:hypothetical protein